MRLSEAEGNHLRRNWGVFEELANQLLPSQRGLLRDKKEEIISLCIDRGIYLYNIPQLKFRDAIDALRSFLDIISLQSIIDAETINRQLLAWKEQFDKQLAEMEDAARELHALAYVSVGDQFQKTGEVKADTLLTLKDMQDLLNPETFNTAHILKSQPFSLTESSREQDEEIQQLIQEGTETGKPVFLPITHDGHWTYLYGVGDNWTIFDSQPFAEDGLTPRQKSIGEASSIFLTALIGKRIVPEYRTTGLQSNHYECGTHVVNAYRRMVHVSYRPRNHRAMLDELVAKQVYGEHIDYGLSDLERRAAEEDRARLRPQQENLRQRRRKEREDDRMEDLAGITHPLVPAHQPAHETTNYNFLLKAGATLCAAASIAAVAIVVLALVGVISVSTFGIGAIAIAGVAAAGLAGYGFFKSRDSGNERPDKREESDLLLTWSN
ncbi:hypothetical protein [Legionella nagasakiensis]|uniref:hypothetical protein n=1 Tax=Legionella nagasakiensis TaxID=535290 RepID=UPI001054A8DC|nr:hypothetical protein [Legionella nagasakiensis]